MLLKILQLIFCVTPLVLSLILYKKPYRFMAKFHASMKQNIRARKLYTRVILFLLLLFHYVYASGHAGEFGILVSTVICAAMFSFKLADRCLSRLHDSMGLFAGISAITLVSCLERPDGTGFEEQAGLQHTAQERRLSVISGGRRFTLWDIKRGRPEPSPYGNERA